MKLQHPTRHTPRDPLTGVLRRAVRAQHRTRVNPVLRHPVIKEIAAAVGRSEAQVASIAATEIIRIGSALPLGRWCYDGRCRAALRSSRARPGDLCFH